MARNRRPTSRRKPSKPRALPDGREPNDPSPAEIRRRARECRRLRFNKLRSYIASDYEYTPGIRVISEAELFGDGGGWKI